MPAGNKLMTPLEWQLVASERSRDAGVLHEAERPLAAAYMAWYAVECLAKALIAAQGAKPPTAGGEGHNLAFLLDRAGLHPSDFSVNLRTHYEQRSVGMRYQHEGTDDHREQFKAAVTLAGRLTTRLRRVLRRQAKL